MRTTLDIDDDVLQAAKARSHGGRLATFDLSVPVRAVKGASMKDLAVIAPAD